MNKVIIRTKSNTYTVKDGVLSAKSDRLVPLRGLDGKMVLRYYFDFELTVPKGVIGIVVPGNEIGMTSVSHVGTFLIHPGKIEEPYIDYKLNTDVIPTVLEKDDVVANIVFVKTVLGTDDLKVEVIIPEEDKTETVAPVVGVEPAVTAAENAEDTSAAEMPEEESDHEESDDADTTADTLDSTQEKEAEVSGPNDETTESKELEEAVQQ